MLTKWKNALRWLDIPCVVTEKEDTDEVKCKTNRIYRICFFGN